jgi:hypothetical protein
MNLEIESRDPMSGHLIDEDGQIHTFRGWLELNSAIQALSQVSKQPASRSEDDRTDDR